MLGTAGVMTVVEAVAVPVAEAFVPRMGSRVVAEDLGIAAKAVVHILDLAQCAELVCMRLVGHSWRTELVELP